MILIKFLFKHTTELVMHKASKTETEFACACCRVNPDFTIIGVIIRPPPAPKIPLHKPANKDAIIKKHLSLIYFIETSPQSLSIFFEFS